MAKHKKTSPKYQLSDPKIKKYLIIGLVVAAGISFAIGIGSVYN